MLSSGFPRRSAVGAVFLVVLLLGSSMVAFALGATGSAGPQPVSHPQSGAPSPTASPSALGPARSMQPGADRVVPSAVPPIPPAERPDGVGPDASNVSSILVGANPYTATYDSENGYVYVPDEGSRSVSVLFGTTVVGTVGVGTEPWSATCDGANGYVYVTNTGSGTVSVLNGTRNVATVDVGADPYSAAYDSSNGYVYVANAGSATVSVINGTETLGNITVGSYPISASYDASDGDVYVTNEYSYTVSVIHGPWLIATVSTGAEPRAATYDPATGEEYVLNLASSSVTVLSGTSVVATVEVGQDPYAATYDPATGDVDVVNDASANVSVINGTDFVVRSVNVGSYPDGATYDSGTGDVYVSNSNSETESVLDGPSLVGTVPVGYYPAFPAYDSGNGYVYVPNVYSGNVSAIFTGGDVNVSETGLPTGTGWWVNLTGGASAFSNTTNLSIGAPEGTSDYSVATTNASYASPAGSFTLADGPLSIGLVFSLVTYPVTFSEAGLPRGSNWSVALGGRLLSSTAATIQFPESNGTYSYSVVPIPGWFSSIGNGTIVVNGSATSRLVGWTAVTFPVIVEENGIPKGTGWWVNVSGGPRTFSNTETLTFGVPNGTYQYSLSSLDKLYASPAGSVSVDGAAVLVEVAFSLVTYPVTFAETGLAPGTNWSVGLYDTQLSSRGSFQTFGEPNGTYLYLLARIPGYAMTPSFGTVTVDGTGLLVTITFTAVPPESFVVSFSETGLPSGTLWVVTFNGTTDTDTGNLVFYGAENGTYAYTVGPVAGFTAIPSHGMLEVSGAPTTQTITFLPIGPSPPSTLLGLPIAEGVALLVGFIVLVAVLAVVAFRRSPPRPAAPDRAPIPPPGSESAEPPAGPA